MTESQAEDMLRLLKNIDDKLDRIISLELRTNAEDMGEIKHYVREISRKK